MGKEGWVTINGNHVLIGSDGTVKKGPSALVGKTLGSYQKSPNNPNSLTLGATGNSTTVKASNPLVGGGSIDTSFKQGISNLSDKVEVSNASNIVKVENTKTVSKAENPARVEEQRQQAFENQLNDMMASVKYANTPEYKALKAERIRLNKEAEKIGDKARALREQVDKEVKPRDQWTAEEKEWWSLLREKPLTPKGKELDKKLFAMYKEKDAKYNESSAVESKIAKFDREAYLSELKDFRVLHPKRTFTPADMSKDYKYFSFKSNIPSYDNDVKLGKAKIVEMSPKEYLQRISYEVFNNSLYRTMNVNPRTVAKYANMMANGTKFDIGFINYKSIGQEGRHRAIAAMLLNADKIPVIIVE